MFTILIVDDEQVEREGIAFLIRKFDIPLEMMEAENGEKALSLIRSHTVDILFTDIKMPFMNGLDLIHQAREIQPKIKSIIFSAYSEFDYARKAIQDKAMSYILKPIDIKEFLDVLGRVIELCDEEAENERREKKLLEENKKVKQYEKSSLLHSLLQPIQAGFDLGQVKKLTRLDAENKALVLLLVETRERFFHIHNEEFEGVLDRVIHYDHEYLNLDEYEGLIFISTRRVGLRQSELNELAEGLIKSLEQDFDIKPFILIGKPVARIEELAQEYSAMEQEADLKYFYKEDSTVVFRMPPSTEMTSTSTELIDQTLVGIYEVIEGRELNTAIDRIRNLFCIFKDNGNYSALYVKYICANMIRWLMEKIPLDNGNSFDQVERIFTQNSIRELENNIVGLISGLRLADTRETENGNTAIKRVLEQIEKEYPSDISLESIAEKVYLTPSYLSHLFKRSTGQGLLQYITSYRLERAEELLLNTNMKINLIGQRVGYQNLSYFCMLFKNRYGMTPARYRESREKA